MRAKIWQRSISLALVASLVAAPAMAGGPRHRHEHGRGCGHGEYRHGHHGRSWARPVYWAPPPPQHHHHHKNRVDAGDVLLATAVGLGVVALWGVAQQQADANARAQVFGPPAGEPVGGWREPQ